MKATHMKATHMKATHMKATHMKQRRYSHEAQLPPPHTHEQTHLDDLVAVHGGAQGVTAVGGAGGGVRVDFYTLSSRWASAKANLSTLSRSRYAPLYLPSWSQDGQRPKETIHFCPVSLSLPRLSLALPLFFCLAALR